MKKLYIIFFISIITALSVNAQQYGLHFMTDVAQSALTNPGYIPRQTFFISLPSPYYSFSAGNLNSDLFKLNNNDEYALNIDEVISTLDGDVKLRSNIHIDELAIGFKVKKLFFTLNTATKISAYAGLPDDFFRFVWDGNTPGTTMNVGPQVNVMAYQEVNLGVNYTFNRNFSVGARLKRLGGLVLLDTEQRDIQVTTSDDIYQLGIDADYIMNVSSYGISNITTDGTIQGTDVTTLDEFSFPGNSGWGIDLGTEINFKDKVRISAAILDLGAINWDQNAYRIRGNGNYTFDGVNIDVPALVSGNDGLETGFVDSLSSAFDIDVSSTSLTKSLPTKTYVSGNMRLLTFDVGVLAFAQIGGGQSYSTIAFSLRKRFGNVLSLGAVYAYQTEGLNNLGVNAALKLGPLQVFTAVDNIYPIINPAKIDNANVRFGVNIAIGTKKQKEFIEGKEAVDKE